MISLPRPLPRVLLCLAALLLPSAALPTPATRLPIYRPQVVARFPHDPAAFTEGFELSGTSLWEGTGLVGASGVRRVDKETGKPLESRAAPLPGVFGEGITLLGGRLYQLTWQSGVAFVYDPATLAETGRLRYEGEGWGLTNDGKGLIMSDGSDTLAFRDPATFAVVRLLRVTANGLPLVRLNELEYAGGWIWANVWQTSRVARIDPRSGRVTAWLDLSDLTREATAAIHKAGRTPSPDDVANGVTYDKARGTLLLTGKRWPTVFEVRVPGLTPTR